MYPYPLNAKKLKKHFKVKKTFKKSLKFEKNCKTKIAKQKFQNKLKISEKNMFVNPGTV